MGWRARSGVQGATSARVSGKRPQRQYCSKAQEGPDKRSAGCFDDDNDDDVDDDDDDAAADDDDDDDLSHFFHILLFIVVSS